jgi:hypothetical protein
MATLLTYTTTIVARRRVLTVCQPMMRVFENQFR